MRSLHMAVAGLLLGIGTPSPTVAQGTIGIDGILSNRVENAVGGGATLAYGHPAATFSLGPVTVAAKAMALADLEIVTGERSGPDICLDGDRYYYRYCSTGVAIDPTVAEGSAPTRAYLAGYGLLEVWRLRFGYGRAGHWRGGDIVTSGLVGFAASPNSWFMVEFPGLRKQEWRIRIEVKLAGPPAY